MTLSMVVVTIQNWRLVLNRLEEICDLLHLKIEPTKRKNFSFGKRGDSTNSTIRLVGVHLDKGLTMKEHINKIRCKARVALAKLCNARDILDDSSARRLFMAFILPIIENGGILACLLASPTEYAKLQAVIESFRKRFPTAKPIDNVAHRASVSLACIYWKMMVRNEGPQKLIEKLRQAGDQCASRKSGRIAATLHRHQISIPKSVKDCALYRTYIRGYERD
jgi:hypothetical protein